MYQVPVIQIDMQYTKFRDGLPPGVKRLPESTLNAFHRCAEKAFIRFAFLKVGKPNFPLHKLKEKSGVNWLVVCLIAGFHRPAYQQMYFFGSNTNTGAFPRFIQK